MHNGKDILRQNMSIFFKERICPHPLALALGAVSGLTELIIYKIKKTTYCHGRIHPKLRGGKKKRSQPKVLIQFI